MPKKKKKTSASKGVTENKSSEKKEEKVVVESKEKSSAKSSKDAHRTDKKDKAAKTTKTDKKDKNIKDVKKETNLIGKKYFTVFSTIFISIFFVFISIQVWVHYNKVHFISLLPADSTVFATEVNLKSIKNSYKFRQWIFTNIINEEDIGTISRSDIGVFMNMDADLNIVKVDDSWMLGISLKVKDRKNIINILKKHVKKVDSEKNVVILDIFGKDVSLIYIGDFMVFSYDMDALYDFAHSIGENERISYKDVKALAPNKSYFTPVNLVYARLDYILQGFMGEITMKNDFSFEAITQGHIDDTIIIGGFSYDDYGVDISMIRKDNFSILPQSEKEELNMSSEFQYKACPSSNISSFSGYDFKGQWVDTQQRFFTFNYSLLQNLSYRFMQDIKEKTDFDIEEDMLSNMKDFYCVSMDKSNKETEYSFIIEVDKNLNKEELFKKLKVAFVRLAPFTKPVLHNYVLKDGTQASEWIINTDENIEEEEVMHSGTKIEVVKFTNVDYLHDLNMAYIEDLIVFGTDLDKLKEVIDFYKSTENNVEPYMSRMSLYPNELYETFDSMNISVDTQRKIRKIFGYISSAESVKKGENLYDIRLNF